MHGVPFDEAAKYSWLGPKGRRSIYLNLLVEVKFKWTRRIILHVHTRGSYRKRINCSVVHVHPLLLIFYFTFGIPLTPSWNRLSWWLNHALQSKFMDVNLLLSFCNLSTDCIFIVLQCANCLSTSNWFTQNLHCNLKLISSSHPISFGHPKVMFN